MDGGTGVGLGVAECGVDGLSRSADSVRLTPSYPVSTDCHDIRKGGGISSRKTWSGGRMCGSRLRDPIVGGIFEFKQNCTQNYVQTGERYTKSFFVSCNSENHHTTNQVFAFPIFAFSFAFPEIP